MTFSSSLLFAKSLVFPKTEKKSSARKSLFGAMICIALSIIPLVVVVGITNGMISEMTARIINLSSSHIQAYVASNINSVSDSLSFTQYAQGLLSIEGVKNVYPEIEISGLAAGKKKRSGIEVRALQTDIFETNEAFSKYFEVCEGSLSDFSVQNGKFAVIGQKMALDLELKAGDTFRIISTRTVNNKIAPKLTSFKVAAIVSSGYQELDQFWVFIPLETAYSSLYLDNASYSVMIESDDAFSPSLVKIQNDVKNYFGRYANVYRWNQIHTAEFENFSSTKVMLIFVMMMIVLVASVNISSAIIMLVMERKKEIAILKSLGATPRGLTLSFQLASLATCTGALAIGLPLSLAISYSANSLLKGIEKIINIFTAISHKGEIHLMDPAYYLSEIVVKISGGEILAISLFTLLLSALVTYIPCRKAGREKPLDIQAFCEPSGSRKRRAVCAPGIFPLWASLGKRLPHGQGVFRKDE